MATILISAPLPGPALSRLHAEGHELIVGSSPFGMGRDGILRNLEQAPDALALITLLSDSIDKTVLDLGPRLKVVANYAVGVDNLDLQTMKHRGIVATNTPGVLTEATADLAMALMLDAFRNVSQGDRLVRQGKWEGWSPTLLVGPRVTGATLGIIGLGRIGQAMAQRARGFDMRVLYHQRTRLDASRENQLNASFVPLEELLSCSDVVSLHCPLTDSTRALLDESRMRKMRRGTILINCARGACVDEQALARLLAEGHIAAAGLDVYEREPHVHPALLTLPNVVLAPHLGSADTHTREKMTELCVESVLDVLAGREPKNRVPTASI